MKMSTSATKKSKVICHFRDCKNGTFLVVEEMFFTEIISEDSINNKSKSYNPPSSEIFRVNKSSKQVKLISQEWATSPFPDAAS